VVEIWRLSGLGLNPATDRTKIIISRSRRVKKTMDKVLRWEKNSETADMAAVRPKCNGCTVFGAHITTLII
jgi:hypothetical protein